MVGPLLDSPELVGKPLQRELEGYRSARRGAYRIIYQTDKTTRVVRVVRIEHRADVYRPMNLSPPCLQPVLTVRHSNGLAETERRGSTFLPRGRRR